MLTQKQFLEKTAKVLCDAGNWAEEHLSDNTTKGAGLSWYLDVLAAEAQCQAYLSGIEEKPTYAHWGPSQSGKSSCLSVELDRKTKTDGTAVGANSALHFDECSRMGWIIPNELEHSFNPPGGGSDGTACVTRFTAKTPENLNFPIRLTFATTDNFRLTLAMGFSLACSEGTGRVEWTVERLNKALESINPEGRIGRKNTCFQEINVFCDMLQFLNATKRPGFTQLYPDVIKELRVHWAECFFLRSPENRKWWIRQVLWENTAKMNSLDEQFSKFLFKGKKAWCTLNLARKLVDMKAVAFLNDAEDRNGFFKLDERIISSSRDGESFIWEEGDLPNNATFQGETQRFALGEMGFGIFQGAIWEMQIPLNVQNTFGNFKNFIERFDILDFPGLSLVIEDNVAQGGVEGTPIAESIKDMYNSTLFKKIIKLGRVFSVFHQYSKNNNIAGLSVFAATDERGVTGTETDRKMIDIGVRQWLGDNPSKNHPPLNIVMSKGSVFMNTAFTANAVQNIERFFQWKDAINAVKSCNQFFFFTVQKLHPFETASGRSIKKFAKNKELKIQERYIEQFNGFVEEYKKSLVIGQLAGAVDSFHHMAYDTDGGVDYMFGILDKQLAGMHTGAVIKEKVKNILSLLYASAPELINPAPGSEDGEEEKCAYLEKLIKNINMAIEAKEPDIPEISLKLKQLFHLDWTTLAPYRNHGNCIEYIHAAVVEWEMMANAMIEKLKIGGKVVGNSLIRYSKEAINAEHFRNWLKHHNLNQQNLDLDYGSTFFPRHVAAWIMNQLPLGVYEGSHVDGTVITVNQEKYRNSPSIRLLEKFRDGLKKLYKAASPADNEDEATKRARKAGWPIKQEFQKIIKETQQS